MSHLPLFSASSVRQGGSWPVRLRLTLCGLAALLLTACGSFGRAPEPTPAPVQLDYMTLDQTAAETIMLDQFTERYPHITVAARNYQQIPTQYLTGDTPPDVMLITPGWFLDSAAATGQLTDLTDLWEQADLPARFPAALPRMSDSQGHQYYVPMGYSWTGLYYNRALFAELGLTPPTTWDEFVTIADLLLANGITPISLPGEDGTLTSHWFSYLILRLQGPDFYRALLAGEVPYGDARVEEALELWRWMFAQGYFSDDAFSTNSLRGLMATVRGDGGDVVREKAAMILAEPGYLEQLPEPFRAELDFVRFPIIDPTVAVGEIATALGFMIPAAAPHFDEAQLLLEFITDAGNQDLTQSLALETDLIPATGLAQMEQAPAKLTQGAAIIDGADQLSPAFIFSLPFEDQQAVGRTFTRALQGVARDGQLDVSALSGDLDELLAP